MKPDQIKRKIFIVDDNVTNLTAGRDLLKPFYDVYPAKSAGILFTILEKALPDLILLDIEMPDMDGYTTLRKLKMNRRFIDIPVIFLTTKNDEGSELQGFDLGAVDYISKPFSPPLLRKRIENQLLILRQRETIHQHADNLMRLVHEKTQDIFNLQNAVLNMISNLADRRDGFIGGHTMRSGQYMEALLYGMIEKGVYADVTINWNMDIILPSMQLHDVGKIAISDTILRKPPEMLTLHETETLKTHVTVGVDAVKQIMESTPNHSFLRHALNIVESHHENWDGTGYPKGLAGEAIPLEGRLMALVDVYDTLVSWRPYKKAFTHEEAVTVITDSSGKQFDPVLVGIFLDRKEEFEKITQKNNSQIPSLRNVKQG